MIVSSYKHQQEKLRTKPEPVQAAKKSTFFQLAGHTECFKESSRPNTILKRATGGEEECFRELMVDELSPFVPNVYYSIKHADGQLYMVMQDLLANFSNAMDNATAPSNSNYFVSVMDIKMGCRTYCEDELANALREAKLRHDMYSKMIEVDIDEPTNEENKIKAITKPRYMIWRETVSSTASLGFRIEAMRLQNGFVDKNFKTTKEEEQIVEAFMRYTSNTNQHVIRLKYLARLYDLERTLSKSKFFQTHELIGTSLLFIHNENDAGIWLIDFAKTQTIPDNISKITHRKKWELGNHEDGYLMGIENLIRIFEIIISRTTASN